MFEHLFSHPSTVARHRAAPYAAERERYLTSCAQQGYGHTTLRLKARELLWIARKLRVHPDLHVTPAQLEAVAAGWHDRQQGCGRPLNTRRTRARFLAEARAWLRFLGGWCPSPETVPLAELREAFVTWMAEARGLSPVTIRCRSQYIDQFLRWYGARRSSLAEVQLEDVDAFLMTCGHRGCSRLSVRNLAAALRAFLRYAGAQGWCRPAIAEGIQGPRVYAHAGLPAGPSWPEVQALLASLDTHQPGDIRDRAILMLFALYGFRAREVAQLRLDHLDWDRDLLWVPRPKARQTSPYPLMPVVGTAIIRYLQTVRPASQHRELFLTRTPPFRPLSGNALHGLTSKRLQAHGVQTAHRGPQALRHACAMHLVAAGLSLKEIGDHLGHRSTEATRVYAKVDLVGLREVAAVDVGGLL
jgi:integrase/recombinase XerD